MTKKYTKKHEWVEQVEGNIWRIGISDYAQEQLGDIVVVELPELGDQTTLGKDCAVIESVKAASDIYAPLSGKIHKINDALTDEPALVNQEAEDKGWLLKNEEVKKYNRLCFLKKYFFSVLYFLV